MMQPLFRFVLVEPIIQTVERDNVTSSGIILTSGKAEERPDLMTAKAKVLAVGPAVSVVKENDIVIYNYFSGNSVKHYGKDPQGKDDVELHLVFEEDILAKDIEKDDGQNETTNDVS